MTKSGYKVVFFINKIDQKSFQLPLDDRKAIVIILLHNEIF